MLAAAVRRLLVASLLSYLCLPTASSQAQEATDTLYRQYAVTPAVPEGQPVVWRNGVSAYLQLLSDSLPSSGDLLTDMARQGTNDDILFNSFFYVSRLAKAVHLGFGITVDGRKADLLIMEVEQVAIPENRDPENQVVAFLRKNAAGENLCSLSVRWRDRAIREAIVEIGAKVSKDEAKRCILEFVWRSFGMFGASTSTTTWVNQTLTENQKIAFLKKAYSSD